MAFFCPNTSNFNKFSSKGWFGMAEGGRKEAMCRVGSSGLFFFPNTSIFLNFFQGSEGPERTEHLFLPLIIDQNHWFGYVPLQHISLYEYYNIL